MPPLACLRLFFVRSFTHQTWCRMLCVRRQRRRLLVVAVNEEPQQLLYSLFSHRLFIIIFFFFFFAPLPRLPRIYCSRCHSYSYTPVSEPFVADALRLIFWYNSTLACYFVSTDYRVKCTPNGKPTLLKAHTRFIYLFSSRRCAPFSGSKVVNGWLL